MIAIMSRNKFVKIKAARNLRKNMTKAERSLWKYLDNRGLCGVKFRRQHIIDGFVVDFYCPKHKIGIEIDGEIHNYQKRYDKERQDIIELNGIRMLRFRNDEILEDIESALKKIKRSLFPLHEMERDVPSAVEGQGEVS